MADIDKIVSNPAVREGGIDYKSVTDGDVERVNIADIDNMKNSPTLGNAIDIDAAQRNNVNGGVQATVDDVYPGAAEGYGDLAIDPIQAAYENQIAANQAATSPGALAPTTYVPGLNQPIRVGGYSGSMIGSTSLFAPTGQIVPMGIFDAREKALQGAAVKAADLEQKKAADQAKANVWDIPEGPRLKNKNYQAKLDKKFNTYLNDTMEKFQKKYGDDWRRAIKDPVHGREFQQGLKQFQYIKERADQVTDRIVLDQAAFDKGDLYLTPKTRKIQNEILNSLGKFEEATDTYGMEKDYVKSVGLDKYLHDNKMVTAEMRTINEYIKRAGGSVSSDQWNTYRTEEVEPRARLMAKSLKDKHFSNDAYSEQDIFENIMSRLGDKSEVKAQFQGASERAKKHYNPDMNDPILVQGTDFGTDAENVIPLDNKSKTGLTFNYTDENGKVVAIKGSDKVTFNSIQNHLVDRGEGGRTLNPFVYVTVESTDEDGNETSNELRLPFDQGEVKAFMYSGKYKKAAEFNEKVLTDFNSKSLTKVYNKDGTNLNEYQDRSEDKVSKEKGGSKKGGELD